MAQLLRRRCAWRYGDTRLQDTAALAALAAQTALAAQAALAARSAQAAWAALAVHIALAARAALTARGFQAAQAALAVHAGLASCGCSVILRQEVCSLTCGRSCSTCRPEPWLRCCVILAMPCGRLQTFIQDGRLGYTLLLQTHCGRKTFTCFQDWECIVCSHQDTCLRITLGLFERRGAGRRIASMLLTQPFI